MIKDEVLAKFAGRNVLVTGGTGLIGRQIVAMLCDAGAHVCIVSLDDVRVDERAEHLRGDLTDFTLCLELTRGMDDVFHVAGIKGSAKVSASMLATHFVPTLMFNVNVLEACKRNRVQRVVYTSSIGAYSNAEVFVEEVPGDFHDTPMDFAGWAKRMAELQVHAYKVQYGMENFSVVRPSNVYGPGDNFDPENAMVVGSLMCRIRAGEDPLLVWGDGSAIRDLVYSRDVAEGVILALHHGTGGRYVNLGSGRGYSIRELVETLAGLLDIRFEFDPSKPSGFPKRVMDIALARELIDFNPSTTLEEGLRETWDWFLANETEYLDRHNYFLQDRQREA
jgi:GDP-L-fucose synthase